MVLEIPVAQVSLFLTNEEELAVGGGSLVSSQPSNWLPFVCKAFVFHSYHGMFMRWSVGGGAMALVIWGGGSAPHSALERVDM